MIYYYNNTLVLFINNFQVFINKYLCFLLTSIRLALVDSSIKPTVLISIPFLFLRCDSLNSTRQGREANPKRFARLAIGHKSNRIELAFLDFINWIIDSKCFNAWCYCIQHLLCWYGSICLYRARRLLCFFHL